MPNGSLFKKFGHNCEIQKTSYSFAKHGKHKKPGFRMPWKIRKMFIINETNRRGYNFLRSQKRMEMEYRQQLLHPFSIHPFSDFRKYWELFMSIIILIQIYSVTLHLAVCNLHFPDDYFIKYSNVFYVRIFTDVISFLDLILSFFTGICNKRRSTITLDVKQISRAYLRSRFLIDLFCSIPSNVIIHCFNSLFLVAEKFNPGIVLAIHFMCLFKLCRYFTVVKYASNFSELLGASYLSYRIFIVCISFVTYIHILSCVCISWTAYENPWNRELIDSALIIRSYGPNASNFLVIYIHFFYTSNLLIQFAGYRLTTFSNASLLFFASVWILSKILFILTLSYFMELYIVHQSSSQKFIDMLGEVKESMKKKHIPHFLRRRMLAYFDVKYQNFYFKESEILNTVSGQLKQEIVMNTCRKLVENVTCFKNLPLSLLVRIVSCLRHEIFLTNDVIAKFGTPGDSMFFISNGTVAVYTKSGKEICHLQDGDHFGEVSLIKKEMNRIASVVAVEVCELYRLEKKDFFRAILPYPDLIDKISNVANERLEKTNIMNELSKPVVTHKTVRVSSNETMFAYNKEVEMDDD